MKFQLLIKLKYCKIKKNVLLSNPHIIKLSSITLKFVMLINVVGILTFTKMINFM